MDRSCKHELFLVMYNAISWNPPDPRLFAWAAKMTSEEKSKRKIRPGAIEADPSEMAILVHYEAEEIVDGTVRQDFLRGRFALLNDL